MKKLPPHFGHATEFAILKSAIQKFILVAACVLIVTSAQATLWMSDGFGYTAGGNLAASGNSPWTSSSGQIQVAAGSLTLTTPSGFADVSGNNKVNTLGTGGGSSYAPFNGGTAITSGSVYYSFLMQVTTLPGSSAVYVTGLLDGTSPRRQF